MRSRFHLLALVLAFALPTISKSQNVFPPSGRVGIGTSSPVAPLHIAASSQKAGVSLIVLEFKDRSSLWNIGITDGGSSFQLSSSPGIPLSLTKSGVLTLSSLRGVGTRMLVADREGVVGTQPVPRGGTPGDNLGNHTAIANLNLQAHDIINVSRIRFDGSPMLYQTSASPWVYHNLPEGYRADYRFLMGFGNIDPSYKLKIEGDAYATGVWIASDKELKGNISPIDSPINKLLELRGVIYDIKPDRATPPYRTAGLLAQEVRAVLPEAVRENSDGQLALNYNATIALLVEAVKQQQTTIRTQQEGLEHLERRVSRLEGSNAAAVVPALDWLGLAALAVLLALVAMRMLRTLQYSS